MKDSMTPPNHVSFNAKKLFENIGEVSDGSIPHCVWNNIDDTTVMIGLTVK